jgi:hypothetical protein
MPNIATLLKGEISRIARKEVRAETESLKKQSSQYRGQIAALKRQVADLEKLLRKAVEGRKSGSCYTGGRRSCDNWSSLPVEGIRNSSEATRAVSGPSGCPPGRFGSDDLSLGGRQGKAASESAPADRCAQETDEEGRGSGRRPGRGLDPSPLSGPPAHQTSGRTPVLVWADEVLRHLGELQESDDCRK